MEKESKHILFSEIGKYCTDISKLVFGGVILAGIMKLDVNRVLLFGMGFAVVLIMVIAGISFTILSNKKS
jgi:hypothetical protein